MTTPAGWFPDPHGQADLRYWDGDAWTDDTRSAEVEVTPDPEPERARPPAGPSMGARVGIGVALLALVGAGIWVLGRGDSDDNVSSTPLATAPQALPGPTTAPPEAATTSTTSDAPLPGLDLDVIVEARVDDVIELAYVGCGAGGTRSATSLGDGRFVTDLDVAAAGWLVEARGLPGFAGGVGPVQVLGTTTDGLTIIGSEGTGVAVEPAPAPVVGQELGIIGTLGTGEFAALAGTVDEVGVSSIGLSGTGTTTDALLGAGVFDHAGHLVGVVSGRSADQLDITLSPVDAPDPGHPPCGENPDRLPPGDVELTDPVLLSYALAQSLADALANDDWPLVRQLEPTRAGHSDQQFVNGWGTLERSTLVPVRVSDREDGSRRHRFLLVAWETDAPATQVTRPFCVTWDVDLGAGTVRQTGIDSVPLEVQAGWLDPGTLRAEAAARC